MLTTVTLNASVDKLYLVDRMVPDTVMRVGEVCNTAGGKGLNVAKVAALAGVPVRAMGFLGGHNGRYVRDMLAQAGIDGRFTETAGETRSCINIRDLSTNRHTELLEPGSPVTEEDLSRFREAYREALGDTGAVAISGSVPRGTPVSFYGELVEAAREKGVPVLLDTSGELLAEGVKAHPTLIKPNLDEIAQLTGRPVDSADQAAETALNLHREGIAYVAVSLGGDGAVLACGEGVFRACAPEIPVVNTVGCGDSMIAGFAAAILRGEMAEEMLRFAVATASANALATETGHIRTADLERLLPLVVIARLRGPDKTCAQP